MNDKFTIKGFRNPSIIDVEPLNGATAAEILENLNDGTASVGYSHISMTVENGGHPIAGVTWHEEPVQTSWRLDEPCHCCQPATPEEAARERVATLCHEAAATAGDGHVAIAEGMLSLARQLLDICGGIDQEAGITLLTQHACILENDGRQGDAVPLVVQAAEIAERVLADDNGTKVLAIGNLGESQLFTGDHKAAVDSLTRAMRLLEDLEASDWTRSLAENWAPMLAQARKASRRRRRKSA